MNIRIKKINKRDLIDRCPRKDIELTEEQVDAVLQLNESRDKTLTPKAYGEWKNNVKISIRKLFNSSDDKKNGTKESDESSVGATVGTVAAVLAFEVIQVPLWFLIAFVHALRQNHDYARKYRKICKCYPKGYMVPEFCMLGCGVLLAIMLMDYSSNGAIQNSANGAVQKLDDLTPDRPGIVIDVAKPIEDLLGVQIHDESAFPPSNIRDAINYAEEYSNIVREYQEQEEDIVEEMTEDIDYSNIVVSDADEYSEPEEEEYGIGGEMREVFQ